MITYGNIRLEEGREGRWMSNDTPAQMLCRLLGGKKRHIKGWVYKPSIEDTRRVLSASY